MTLLNTSNPWPTPEGRVDNLPHGQLNADPLAPQGMQAQPGGKGYMMTLASENEIAGTRGQPFIAEYGSSGNRCVRAYKVPWGEYETHVDRFLGFTVKNGVRFNRYLPFRDYSQREQICTAVSVRGWGYRGQDPDQVNPEDISAPLITRNKYEWAILFCTFECVRYPIGDVDPGGAYNLGLYPGRETQWFCYKDVRPGRELIAALPGTFTFNENDNPIGPRTQLNRPIPIHFPYDDVIVTWKNIPVDNAPFTAIDELRTYVNSGDMFLPPQPPPEKYEPQTVLFLNWEPIWTWFSTGARSIDLRYHFRVRRLPVVNQQGQVSYVGWNHEPVPNGEVRRIFRGETNTGPYKTGDLNRLFKPEP